MRCLMSFVVIATLLTWGASQETLAGDEQTKEEQTKEEQGRVKPGATLEAQADKAIDRGCSWLRTQQQKHGGFPSLSENRADSRAYSLMDLGLDALVLFTLAHGGARANDKAVKKCMARMQSHYRGDPRKGSWDLAGSGKLTVYVASMIVLALDALHDATGGKSPKVEADRYGMPKPPKPVRCKYAKRAQRWIEELVRFLASSQDSSGGWRYPGNPLDAEEAPSDLSNTQYALLALAAAARCGIHAPIETWQKAAQHVLREQETDGIDGPWWIRNPAWSPEAPPEVPPFTEAARGKVRGWCYLPGQTALPTGSMTAAGVTSLALIKEQLWLRKALEPKTRAAIDIGLRDGLIWLSEFFDVTRNPEASGAPAMWHFYWLYGLERAAVKTGVKYVGKHDWYAEGARFLLAGQHKSGAWPAAGGQGLPADHTESAITQTCFAVLFLRRATAKPVVPMTPTVTGGGDR